MAARSSDLVDELARVCNDRGVARMLVLRAGFPEGDIPAFDVPRVFWHKVISAARDGKGRGGVQAIVDEVAHQFPGNAVLASYQADGAEGDPAPPADPIAAQLEALYTLLAERRINGEDTTWIEAEILDRRRRKRHGPTLNPGEHLAEGRFRLLEVIGRGGFAVVWKAYDNEDRRLVAVKVLHGEFTRVASRRERFFRGAKRMAELQHPNVVRVVVPEGGEEGFFYFVMELVTGGDLHRAVIAGKLDAEQALTAIESIADALATAHASGLVHRDVKPENILLRGSGVPVLSDFDLVQARDTTGGTRTNALGSVLYAAPEQNQDASRVDHRADVYSLGMTAVFCIYGKKLPQSAMYRRVAFLGELECTAAVRDVLRRAVALDPESRFESMTSFRLALAAARRGGDEEDLRVEAEQLRQDPPAASDLLETLPHGRSAGPPGKDAHGLELVLVPGGQFSMGSADDDELAFDRERPQHEVEVPSFYLAKTPVTNAQYARYLDANPDVQKPEHWDDPGYDHPEQPVVGVLWHDAQAYCEWAGLRLPTEAEWEYACRARTTTRYYSGDDEEDLARVGWYAGNSGRRLHAVGVLEPNPFGLYDMHGNVWEWCADPYGDYDVGSSEPVDYAKRVNRGGSFNAPARAARSAYRCGWHPDGRYSDLGFRPAKDHPQ